MDKFGRHSLGDRTDTPVSLQAIGRLKVSDSLIRDRAKIAVDFQSGTCGSQTSLQLGHLFALRANR
jgi:hypothetical protein